MKISNASPKHSPETIVTAYDETNKEPLGYLVIDRSLRGKACGGIRILPDVSLDEIRLLARCMTLKFGFVGKAMGGAKAGIIMPKGTDAETRSQRVRQFGRSIAPYLRTGAYYFGTDMGSTSEDLAELLRGAGLEAPPSFHQESRTGYFTALSIMHCLEAGALVKGMELSRSTIAIEGFGSVGSSLGLLAAKRGIKLVAVSTREGALYNAKGLDHEALIASHKKLGDAFVLSYKEAESIAQSDLFSLPVNILAPCARPEAIHAGNASAVRAGLVCGGANFGVSPEAEQILFEKNILSIPHYAANCGGIVGGRLQMAGLNDDAISRFIQKHYGTALRGLLERSREVSEPPLVTTDRYSLERFNEMKKFPLSLSKKIVRRLIDRHWLPRPVVEKAAYFFFADIPAARPAPQTAERATENNAETGEQVIRLELPRVQGNRVIFSWSPNRVFADNHYWVEYPDLERVEASPGKLAEALFPLCLAFSAIEGVKVRLPVKLPDDILESLNNSVAISARQNFHRNSPPKIMNGDRAPDYKTLSGDHTGLFFGGGTESLLTLARLLDQGTRPTIISFGGPKWSGSNPERNRFKFIMDDTVSRELGLPLLRVRTNFKEVVNADAWKPYLKQKVSFVNAVLFLPFFISFTLPVAEQLGLSRLMNGNEKMNFPHEYFSFAPPMTDSYRGIARAVTYKSDLGDLLKEDICRILYRQYPHIARFQYSCWRNHNERWCHACESCLEYYCLLRLNGLPIEAIGLEKEKIVAHRKDLIFAVATSQEARRGELWERMWNSDELMKDPILKDLLGSIRTLAPIYHGTRNWYSALPEWVHVFYRSLKGSVRSVLPAPSPVLTDQAKETV